MRLRGIFAGSKSGGKYRFSTFRSPIVNCESLGQDFPTPSRALIACDSLHPDWILITDAPQQ
jgi:hypothetical protein